MDRRAILIETKGNNCRSGKESREWLRSRGMPVVGCANRRRGVSTRTLNLGGAAGSGPGIPLLHQCLGLDKGTE